MKTFKMFQQSSEDEEDSDSDLKSPPSTIQVPIFTELLELIEYGDGAKEWKEVARWVKYEETVEEAGNRFVLNNLKYLLGLFKIDGVNLTYQPRTYKEFFILEDFLRQGS